MRPQYLDQMDLERERGITIKMAPVQMHYRAEDGEQYTLNLIDTPGHSDFAYEVSRALQAVEGAVLLVDGVQGIQAQTLSNFRMATRAGLTIIGAVSKVDLRPPHLESTVASTAALLGVSPQAIVRLSGKTGEGVGALLEAIVRTVPPPRVASQSQAAVSRALIFDSQFDDHKGIVAYVRVVEGAYRAHDSVKLLRAETSCTLKEIGYFAPQLTKKQMLAEGEIGYCATGLKDPQRVRIGDTIARFDEATGEIEGTQPLSGYREPAPVVFVSFYPDGETKFEDLEEALMRLRLNDAALTIEREANEALGRGLRVGFLGQLHFDITSDRLRREFRMSFLTSFPSVQYRVISGGQELIVREPHEWPERADRVFQPMIRAEIVTPEIYVGRVMNLKNVFDLTVLEVKNLGENLVLEASMPLHELIRDFDDQLKSVSSGFASLSYEIADEAEADVEKLEILIAEEVEPALTRIVPRRDLEREARVTVERLRDLLPREQFAVALQARARGRIIARETLPALKKDVTGYLYGGDRSRKMKLWKKQKRGKEKLKGMGRVTVPVHVFRELLKK
jgi:GTP-binding protein LepA